MKIFVAPHAYSEGAELLKEKLLATGIKPEGSNYKWKEDHLVISWGCATKKSWHVPGIRILNDYPAVSLAVDKIATLKKLKENGVSVPEFSTNIEDAKGWINAGETVFCRTKTKSSGGDGIVVAKTLGELVSAPLYTLYKLKKFEYRVAVVDGVIIDFMQKKKRSDWNVETQGEVNFLIRSHDNGWIFAREDVNPPKMVLDLAKKSVEVLGLNFGSVDIIYNLSEQKAYVLEINTAPGLEEGGTSLERYGNAFLNLVAGTPITPAPYVAPAVVAAAPAAPVVPKTNPIPIPAAPIPAAQPKNQNSNKSEYSLDGLTNVKIITENGVTKITANVAGLPKRIKVWEGINGNTNFWYQSED